MTFYVIVYNSWRGIDVFEFNTEAMAQCFIRNNEVKEFVIIQGTLIEKTIN
ncbi:MAG: hypothetical protein J6J35_01425 [Alphaproteobacteria bacterium]|nr:hypothetical protein [Alphaproteobacteria bacterium]